MNYENVVSTTCITSNENGQNEVIFEMRQTFWQQLLNRPASKFHFVRNSRSDKFGVPGPWKCKFSNEFPESKIVGYCNFAFCAAKLNSLLY